MKEEIVRKLYQQKYSDQYTFDDYQNNVSLGLQIIKTSDVNNQDANACKAINLALEYNIELMVTYLAL